jgi:hypothetical protein
MLRSATRLLLIIYGLSVMSNSFLDAGHEVLHYFKNAIHHHEHHDHHHVRDHHIAGEPDVQIEDALSEINLTIFSCLVFCENAILYDLPLSTQTGYQHHSMIAKARYGYPTPPFAPPLF